MASWTPDSHDIHTGKLTRTIHRIRIQGACVEVTRKLWNAVTPSDAGRGVVTNFSRASRMRMLRTIAKVDWKEIRSGVFITLTYPDEYFDREQGARTYDRARFVLELERKLRKKICVLWRLEYEPRKSGKHVGLVCPHFHLMALNVSFVHKRWIRQTWRRILGHRGKLVTWVKGIRGPEGCGRYLAKYVAKKPVLDDAAYRNMQHMAGRKWGICRPSLLPMCPVERFEEISEGEYAEALAAFRAVNPWLGSCPNNSFTVLGEIAKMEFIKNLSERA